MAWTQVFPDIEHLSLAAAERLASQVDAAVAGGANIVSKDIVPPDWGSASKQEVTVAAGKANVFDFSIP